MDVVAEVASLPPGTRVGLPHPCRVPRRNAASMLRRLAPRTVVIEAESGDDPSLAECDVVVVWSEAVLAGLPPSARVLSWTYGVDAAALEHVRRQLLL
jgi:hypothetical protein